MTAAARLGLLAGLALLGACSPDPPTEAEARATYEAREADLSTLEREVREAVDEMNLTEVVSEDDPHELEKNAGRDRRRARFRETVLPEIAERLGLLGVRVTLVDDPVGDGNGTLGTAGEAAPKIGDGSRRAADGIAIAEDRKLGYGVYEIDDDGQTREVRGIEVYIASLTERSSLEILAFLPVER